MADVLRTIQILEEHALRGGGQPLVDGLWMVPPDGRTANSADFFPFPDISVTDRT